MDRLEAYMSRGLYVVEGKGKTPPDDAPFGDAPFRDAAGDTNWSNPADAAASSSSDAKEAKRLVWKSLLGETPQSNVEENSRITIAEFVELKFLPGHVALKRASGRTHYQAILKHVLTPETVERVFRGAKQNPRIKLKALPDWPYLDALRLCDVQPAHVQNLISAAMARGYSSQTVTHIRNVVSSIFSHAKREHFFAGANPASAVKLPRMTRRQAHSLGAEQTAELLRAMKFPEKELSLLALLTGMNVAEICGLKWKHVNLAEEPSRTDEEEIAPHTIAVRTQWHRGELASVKPSRRRGVAISTPLQSVLADLQQRPKFTGPDDFVLISRVGTPVCQTNIVARRLKPIGRQLEMPWLSWHVLLRAHTSLAAELGERFEDYVKALLKAPSPDEKA